LLRPKVYFVRPRTCFIGSKSALAICQMPKGLCCLPCCNFIPLEVGFSIFFPSFPLNDVLKQIGFTFCPKSHPMYLGGLVNMFTRFKAWLIVSLEYCFLNNFSHSITHSISHIYNNSTKCVEFMNIVIWEAREGEVDDALNITLALFSLTFHWLLHYFSHRELQLISSLVLMFGWKTQI